jgi:2-polyprenyl-3-methyl-5-hydroxy-6-metoxy-1,4-benzoquinol methylase
MERIPRAMLIRMAGALSAAERDEMAIPSYLHSNPLMRWMAWKRVEVLAKRMDRLFAERPETAGSRVVMDFGCGTGILFREASRHAAHVYGIDLVLDAARLLVDELHLKNVTLLSPTEAEHRIPENEVDIVVAAEVLEHLDDLEDTLRFFASRLRPDGKLLISVPTENSLYRLGRKLAGFRGDYHVHRALTIHEAILRCGFRKVRIEKVPAAGPLAIYWVADYVRG